MIVPRAGRRNTRPTGSVFRPNGESGLQTIFKNSTQRLLLPLVFVLLLATITKPPEFSPKVIGYDISSQPVALEEVRSEIYFQTEDLQLTKAKRDEAAAKIPDTYAVDQERVQSQLRLLNERIESIMSRRDELDAFVREALLESTAGQSTGDIVSKVVRSYSARLEEDPSLKNLPDATTLSVWLTPTPESIPVREFREPSRASSQSTGLREPEISPIEFAYAPELSRLAREGLAYVLGNGVIAPVAADMGPKKAITIFRDKPIGNQAVRDEAVMGKVPTPRTAQDALNAHIMEAAQTAAGVEASGAKDWAKLQAAAFEMAKPFVTDTLLFDQVRTEGAREQAREAVSPVLKEIQPGQVIQRSGDPWTAQSRSDVRTYWGRLAEQRAPRLGALGTIAAHGIFVALALGCLVRSMILTGSKRQHLLRDMNLAFLVMCTTLALGRLVSYFDPSGFVLPVASGAILLAILLNARIAVMTSLITAALVSIQFGYDWRLLFVDGAMSIAGVFGTYRVRKRGDMTSAALKATLVGVVSMAAVTLAADSLHSDPALRRILLVLFNGVACIFIVPGVLSPLEKLFGITTDIQLLEYSDLNNEVLSRMAIEIPATYSHSLMLGQLAQAAAEAVGANGLLARVCAYYHDIGKLRRPEYYSENQAAGLNIHDELPARLSARAIASHVPSGVELAHEYHLPKPIIDAIAEHHGTTLISFFYHQARDRDKRDDISEGDFRYAGPKPQNRETAILMICDAVESGVRSIKNPNEERVREFVDKIIMSRSADRQFDECDLTLRELDTIKEAVTRRMVSGLHTRVAYPERGGEHKADNVVPISGGAK